MKKFTKVLCMLLSVLILSLLTLTSCETTSAYEIALNNGYTGTEQEWLDSLKGTNGVDGQDYDLYDAYEKCVENDEFSGTFFDFLKEIYNFSGSTNDIEVATNIGLSSVVSITCNFTNKNTGNDIITSGAGVFYKIDNDSECAYVITNYHVVYNANGNTSSLISDDIYIHLYGCESNSIPCQYIGGVASYDIAILYVDSDNFESIENSSAIQVDYVDSDDLSVGETVVAVGNPGGYGISASTGIISKDSEYIQLQLGGSSNLYRSLRIDSAVNPGNSGGGLFNDEGQLIGIVNAKDEDMEGVGYAIPSNIAIAVAQNIIDNNGKCLVNLIGITTNCSNATTAFKNGKTQIIETIVINEITNGLAKDNGTLQVDDVLTKATLYDTNGNIVIEKEITRHFQVVDLMLNARDGYQLKLEYKRSGGNGDVTLTLNSNYHKTVS